VRAGTGIDKAGSSLLKIFVADRQEKGKKEQTKLF
jgi:hypothetical protein